MIPLVRGTIFLYDTSNEESTMASGLYHADNATPYVRKMGETFGFTRVTGRMLDTVCEQRRSRQIKRNADLGETTLECGPGTERVDNVCVLSANACASGAVLSDGRCIIDNSKHPCSSGTRWHIESGKCHVDCGLHGQWNMEKRSCVVVDDPIFGSVEKT